MENRFHGFQEKRMYIFGELVKKYWDGKLNNSEDLDTLVFEIRDKFNFTDKDIPFIKDHIRMAMGLAPKGDVKFTDELSRVKSAEAVDLPVINMLETPCEFCGNERCKSSQACKYEALSVYNRQKKPVIVDDKCLSCGECVTNCDFGALADKIEFLPVIDLLRRDDIPVFATVAPAIVGQFGDDVSMGQLRTALKLLGFQDMVEVALFADILTIKEAFEFNHLVRTEEDFFLTSCCCPVWFNLAKKSYPKLFRNMSPTVSPMIASGRILKKLYKNARVVFIAPCIAKKAEIKEPELKGAIDFVINFRELQEVLKVLNYDLSALPSIDKDQASFGGRIYARTGGVSFSVKSVVNRLEPTRVIKLKAKRVSGIQNCKEVLDQLSKRESQTYNFIEGMGCKGGCVGGPRTIIEAEKATKFVNEFGEDSLILTPFDNLNVMKILRQLGIQAIEEIVEDTNVVQLLTRKENEVF